MAGHRKFFITPEQLRKEYEELKSCGKIARKYGVSDEVVRKCMKKYGIDRIPRFKGVYPDKVKEMAEQGMTAREIAKHFGVHRLHINRIAREHRFHIRDTYHTGIKRGGTKGEYRMILAINHPYKNNMGYVMEHRLIMEEHLGRFLSPDEIVHHVIGNLTIITKFDHNRLHHLGIKNPRKKSSGSYKKKNPPHS